MKMDYFVFGTNDMEAAIGFYDALFEGMGLARMKPSERMTYWLGDGFAFAVATPFDGARASNGNGTMIGFNTGSAKEVTRLHAKALALGARDEGAPTQKGPKFSGYLRDLDGNKICLSD